MFEQRRADDSGWLTVEAPGQQTGVYLKAGDEVSVEFTPDENAVDGDAGGDFGHARGPQLYVSDCCGTTFVPGHGPDDIYGAEKPGTEVPVGTQVPSNVAGEDGIRYISAEDDPRDVESRVVKIVSEEEATLYDAIRGGRCPCCGEWCPGLNLVGEFPEYVGVEG